MTRKKSVKSARAAMSLGSTLMLAPAVMALRLPLMATEAQSLNPWRGETADAFTEKAGAFAEGMMAAQFSYAQSAASFWLEAFSGKTPSLLSGVAAERAMVAALKPSGKRVKANYDRLSKRG